MKASIASADDTVISNVKGPAVFAEVSNQEVIILGAVDL